MRIEGHLCCFGMACLVSLPHVDAAGTDVSPHPYENIPVGAIKRAHAFVGEEWPALARSNSAYLRLDDFTAEQIAGSQLGRAYIAIDMGDAKRFLASGAADPRPFASDIAYQYEILLDGKDVAWFGVQEHRDTTRATGQWSASIIRKHGGALTDTVRWLWSGYPPEKGYVVTLIHFPERVGDWILVFGPDGLAYDDRYQSASLAGVADKMRDELTR